MAKKTSNSRIGVTLWLLTAALVAMNGVGTLSAYAADDNDTSLWIWKLNADMPQRVSANAVPVEGPGGVSQVMVVGSAQKTPTSLDYLTSSILIDPKKKGGTSSVGQVLTECHLFSSLTVLTTGVNKGRVLVAGGYKYYAGKIDSVDTCELINPQGTGTAASTGHLKTARAYHTAIQLEDGSGRILVAGGIKYVSGVGSLLSSSELYNPTDGNWTETDGNVTQARFLAPAVVLTKGPHEGKVLVVGGFVRPDDPMIMNFFPTKTCELFDPETGKWNDPEGAASLNVPRGAHTLTLLKDGRVLAAGGRDKFLSSYNDPATTYRDWEIYNPEKDEWKLYNYDEDNGTRLMFPAAFHTATLLDDNKTLLVGGDEPYAAQLYDPDENVWRFTSEALWYPRSYLPGYGGHTATLVDGKVLVCLGGPTVCELFQPPSAPSKRGVSRPVQKLLTAD